MFRPRTTIVVGAGAGVDFGFPVGATLVERIAEQLDHSDAQASASNEAKAFRVFLARHAGLRPADLTEAAQRISDGIRFSTSIDGFLHQHSDDSSVQWCGKAAILFNIFRGERTSSLYVDPENPTFPLGIRQTWLGKFSQRLFDNCGDRVVDALSRVAVISFNYDRCFEHFLTQALAKGFALSNEEAAELVGNMTIVHPYGTVGDLPPKQSPLPFGTAEWQSKVDDLVGRIRTYSEASDDTYHSAKEIIRQTETLIFLGFGFLPQNMDILQPGEGRSSIDRIFATALNVADDQIEALGRNLGSRLFESRKQIRPISIDPAVDCAGFFDRYHFSLLDA